MIISRHIREGAIANLKEYMNVLTGRHPEAPFGHVAAEKALERLEAALEGYVIVPREPTRKMVDAAVFAWNATQALSKVGVSAVIYRVMITHSDTPPGGM